jgi:hypothetical protein
MKRILCFLPVLLLFIVACNDKGNGTNPLDNTTNKRDKGDKYKDDNKDDFPNNRDEGMDRDYEDDSNDGSIVGRWRIVDFKSEEDEEMSEEELRSMRSAIVEFKRDGSFSSSSTDPDGEKRKTYGTYTYNARSKTLVTEEENGKKETLEVEFRGKNRVMLTIDGGTVTMERD